jgi:hypothetical protein
MEGFLGFSGHREELESSIQGKRRTLLPRGPNTRLRSHWRINPERIAGFELGRSLGAAQSKCFCK